MYRQEMGTARLLPWLGHERDLARRVAAHAMTRAASGDADTALAGLRPLDRMVGLAAKSSDTLIRLLVAESIHRLALRNRAVALQITHHPNAARAAWEAVRADRTAYEHIKQTPPAVEQRVRRRGGVTLNMILPVAGAYDIDFALPREAEYASFDQGALGVMMVLSTVGLILWMIAVGVVYLRRRRRGSGDEPVLLWIGWRRLLIVLAIGVGLPGAVYLALAWSPGWGSHRYGINYATARVIVEWALLAVGVVAATTEAGLWVIRRRAVEVGLVRGAEDRASGAIRVRPSARPGLGGGGWVFAVVSALTGAAGMAYFVAWPWGREALFVPIALGLPVWGVVWVGWVIARVKRRARGACPRYCASVARSLVPLLAGAMLLVALVGGGSLRVLEAVRVGQLVDRGAFVWSEVEHTAWRKLRDRLVARVPAPGILPAPGTAPGTTPGIAPGTEPRRGPAVKDVE